MIAYVAAGNNMAYFHIVVFIDLMYIELSYNERRCMRFSTNFVSKRYCNVNS